MASNARTLIRVSVLVAIAAFAYTLTRPAVRSIDPADAPREPFEEAIGRCHETALNDARRLEDGIRLLNYALQRTATPSAVTAKTTTANFVSANAGVFSTTWSAVNALTLKQQFDSPRSLGLIADRCKLAALELRTAAATHRTSPMTHPGWQKEWDDLGRRYGPVADALEAAERRCRARAKRLGAD